MGGWNIVEEFQRADPRLHFLSVVMRGGTLAEYFGAGEPCKRRKYG
jgi:hypothetical protein